MINPGSILKVKPALRWAGGKTWLTERIREFIPSNFNNYFEPFLGGASIYLNLINTNNAFLSDLNFELINFYTQVKYNLESLLSELNDFENTEKYFYEVRNFESDDPIIQAARFFYLNKTCFNGLYRVNQKGKFNVPFGYREVEIVDREVFLNLRTKLKAAKLLCEDFSDSIDRAKRGDFVFLDPPYTVAHNNNGFVQYNQKIFSWQDQERLAKKILELNNNKVNFLMTNACHDSIKQLYKGIGNHYEIDRQSTISGVKSSRAKVSELIITNIF